MLMRRDEVVVGEEVGVDEMMVMGMVSSPPIRASTDGWDHYISIIKDYIDNTHTSSGESHTLHAHVWQLGCCIYVYHEPW